MLSTTLWLIRHGEPEENMRGRCYGRLDAALSPAGREQMARVADRLTNEPLAAIYASPRRRTIASAEMLGPVQIEPSLAEIDFGDFEGRTYDEIARDYPDLYRIWMERPTEIEFPHGESFSQMQRRVLAGLEELRARHAGETIALVTHGGVNRVALADALSIPPARIFGLAQHFAALNRIRYLSGFPLVELVNG